MRLRKEIFATDCFAGKRYVDVSWLGSGATRIGVRAFVREEIVTASKTGLQRVWRLTCICLCFWLSFKSSMEEINSKVKATAGVSTVKRAKAEMRTSNLN
ncbi:hypothetical protein L1987_32355 [Smallanthus sonchifolius]|uniref:Uncharacterized protein n=1 Tax=Smallanthus sonchifolius TaxID=185202 RepID=A0ACB9I9L5_9ASTR|nr:hypothetical protein L1987_32355 [Smallanthus sonchifolius]